MNNAVTLNKLGDIYIFQGDIVLDQDQVERLVDSYAPKLRSTCTNSFINYWPNHKVYYTYASGFSGQSAAQAAINEWQNKTGLDFVYGTGSGNYIEIGENYSNGNYSNSLGMKGGKQIISLQIGAYNAGTIMHEIGHSVGLIHEHCRADRDNYIIVHEENIESGKKSQFQKVSKHESVNIGPFDFNSVMIYSSNAFAKGPGLYTITKLNNSPFYSQRRYLSTLDAEGVKAIYGPPYHKLVTSVISSDYQDYGQSEQWHVETDNTIYFYSDKACTVQAPLQYDRMLKVNYTSIFYDHGNPSYSYNSFIVTVPAGSTCYNIGVATTNMHSEFGMEFGYDEYYSLTY
ncbi:MAG: hypothetical protein K5843_04875 [Bacteroidales bacterium]|nr:hypothetical protein [Bacteroidales bacterium]